MPEPSDQLLEADAPKLLLDQPSRHPDLGFPETARALGDVIASSTPQFAVGIFGRWGSGKSTLMGAIKAHLRLRDPDGHRIIPVDFNAWRYEREEHLIVPMLDTLREAILAWSREEEHKGGAQSARTTAATIGRAIRSIVAGLSMSMGVPGAISLSWDANRALQEAHEGEEDAEVPRSFYHASFRALQEALTSFVGEKANRRIVVFVDDLDRCLPDRALQVLESMKLFFDFAGFVFVVGLDHEVVDYALDSKFRRDAVVASITAAAPQRQPAASSGYEPTGADYVKKVFQLEYRLPPVGYEDLDDFLEAALRDSPVSDAQASDLRGRVRAHLDVMVGETPVNPREVKRYINEYTLLMAANPELDRDAVLCLRTLVRRLDWSQAQGAMLQYRDAFVDALRARQQGDERALENLDPELEHLPLDFLDYVTTGPAASLLGVQSFDPYVRSGESLRSALSPELLAAVRTLGQVRRDLREAGGDPPKPPDPQLLRYMSQVGSAVGEFGPSGPLREALLADLSAANEALQGLMTAAGGAAPSSDGDAVARLESQVSDIAKRLLRLYRVGVTPPNAPVAA